MDSVQSICSARKSTMICMICSQQQMLIMQMLLPIKWDSSGALLHQDRQELVKFDFSLRNSG